MNPDQPAAIPLSHPPAVKHGYRCTLLFFFSSRRRHTRLTCDWSSDVCSSDLADLVVLRERRDPSGDVAQRVDVETGRSEERRVGKECRTRWSTQQEKKNTQSAA